MTVVRYENNDEINTGRLRKPLTFHFSKKTARNRLFKASMGETLASWDISDPEANGIPTDEIIELYKRLVRLCITTYKSTRLAQL